MLSSNIDLEVAGDLRGAVGLRARPVRLHPDEIDGQRQGDPPDEVRKKEERTGGNADEDNGRPRRPDEVAGDLGG